MFDTSVSMQGWVGSDVTYKQTPVGWVASFRLGVTPRVRRDEQWVDGDTAWYTVNAWRSLGRNITQSVKRGDAVLVVGRLRADSWERDGVPTTTMVVDATSVGPDLCRVVATSRKPEGGLPEGTERAEAGAVRAVAAP